MKMIRKPVVGIIGIAVLIAALCCVALAADLSAKAEPAAVDAAHYADFMSDEVLDLQDLAQWAEIQRRMFNRITPPGGPLLQPMSPPVVPFNAANYTDDFLEELLHDAIRIMAKSNTICFMTNINHLLKPTNQTNLYNFSVLQTSF